MGKTKQIRATRRAAAEERNAAYGKLTIEQKLARPTTGAKERKKLLAKQQNQKRA